MPTLLLRCAAPLQAWDTQSKFGVRTTGREPSKSGIIGLLCAALGRSRSEPVADLAALTMAVRVDKEGIVLRDWHTAGKGGYLKARGSIERKNLITSTRYYLADAAFLVGLESADSELLERLHIALNNPQWMLFLGRKSCPPADPVYLDDGIRQKDLMTALNSYPWLGRNLEQYRRLEKIRLAIDDNKGAQVQQDHPLSFVKGQRQFLPRRISTLFIEKPPFRNQEGIALEEAT